ncbi:MAG: BrnT family toxin [Acetobacteraceae bacterium]|nr:BrnT family toxin [Acetobacteraceae bacterium]
MDDDEFEWHEPKRTINLEKHGIDFDDAISIWAGPVATRLAPHKSEERFVSVGVAEERIIAVVWTLRGQRRRLISARRARDHERACYTAFLERGGQRPH